MVCRKDKIGQQANAGWEARIENLRRRGRDDLLCGKSPLTMRMRFPQDSGS